MRKHAKLEFEVSNSSRNNIKNKLDRLRLNPRRELDAHPLYGKLAGKWSCWLASNIRLIYLIDDTNETIIIEAVGTHKMYKNDSIKNFVETP